jgi:bacterioferritin
MSAYPASSQRDQIHPFLSGVAEIRRRARGHIGAGSATAGQGADRQAVLRLLNAALCTELVCALRYRRYCGMSPQGLDDTVRGEFSRRAQEEQGHAQQIAARIVELGGEPDPEPLSAADQGDGKYAEREYADREYAQGEDLSDMLAEDLIAERIAIDTYREIIRFVGDSDSTTRQLFESIVAAEQEHAAGMASLREDIRRQERAAAANHAGQPVEELR